MKKIIFYLTISMILINIQALSAWSINDVKVRDKYDDNKSASITVNAVDNLPKNNYTARKYILGPNDVIDVTIYNVPSLSQSKIRVQHNGNITLPLLGEYKVAGLSVKELHDILEKKYSEYLKNPDISINVVENKPFIVYISGGVLNPGSYELNTSTNTYPYLSKPESFIERKTPILSNVLIAAGGVSYDADFENIEIKNSFDGSKYKVNLLKMLDGDNSQDIFLMSGDNVYVPKLPSPLLVNMANYKKYASSSFAPHQIPVRVYGYVNTPGLVQLESSQSLNLNSAITQAGGYLKDSAYAPKKVVLSRMDNNGKMVHKVINPTENDVLLMPNDIVYVPEKGRPLIGKTFDFMTRMIYPFYMFSNAYNTW